MPALRTPGEVLDHEYLEARCALVELAGMLDRYDRSVTERGSASADAARIDRLRDAMKLLTEPSEHPDRAERLLLLFTDD